MEFFKAVGGDDAVLADVDGALDHLRARRVRRRPDRHRRVLLRRPRLVPRRRCTNSSARRSGSTAAASSPRASRSSPRSIGDVASLQTPWLGLFGDQDGSIPVDDVETAARRARRRHGRHRDRALRRRRSTGSTATCARLPRRRRGRRVDAHARLVRRPPRVTARDERRHVRPRHRRDRRRQRRRSQHRDGARAHRAEGNRARRARDRVGAAAATRRGRSVAARGARPPLPPLDGAAQYATGGPRRLPAVAQGLHAQQATELGEILLATGYDDATIARVQALVRKERLGTDPDVQVLEDALCLVFLETQLADIAARLEPETLTRARPKTAKKMSDAGPRCDRRRAARRRAPLRARRRARPRRRAALPRRAPAHDWTALPRPSRPTSTASARTATTTTAATRTPSSWRRRSPRLARLRARRRADDRRGRSVVVELSETVDDGDGRLRTDEAVVFDSRTA